ETVMRADGEISESHANAEGPGGQNGMRVKLVTMDERTHVVHKRLLVRAAVMARQLRPPPIPQDAGSRPKTIPTKITAPFPAALPGIAPIKQAPVDPDRQIVPANPFAELHPSALEHFVECTLYEETAPHDLREIETQMQEAFKKEPSTRVDPQRKAR